jgi:hypothetical protein
VKKKTITFLSVFISISFIFLNIATAGQLDQKGAKPQKNIHHNSNNTSLIKKLKKENKILKKKNRLLLKKINTLSKRLTLLEQERELRKLRRDLLILKKKAKLILARIRRLERKIRRLSIIVNKQLQKNAKKR